MPNANDWLARLARLQPWYLLMRYPNRLTRSIFAFVNGSIAIGIMTSVSVYTKQPLIFPSLGPSAFLFFYTPSAPTSSPRNAILGHGAGVLVGWFSFWIFGTVLGLDAETNKIVAAAFSLGLISAIMIAADIAHPPAASTTLIVSLGLMKGWQELVAIMFAVLLLTAQAYLFNHLSGISYPLWSSRPGRGSAGLQVRALQTNSAAPVSDSADPYASLADNIVARKKVTPPDSDS